MTISKDLTFILEGKHYLQGKFIKGPQLESYLLSGGRVLHANKIARYKVSPDGSLKLIHHLEGLSQDAFRSLEDIMEDGAYKLIPASQ
ncbi:hypothetical protein P9133_23975 [Bacillus thuringiensis]|uniref:Uncharacterized protein n=1 Tax=Bacillus thuringiensis HD-771 TaxID=1218175 RepID=A0A9W3J990_BACTU|nr:hypothetical protein [Bacillus thuringiensis]AFQ14619.1 hypothetical protein BTG_05635 [Bacillus thuringiensis HD-771]MEC3267444.1 hypothetical protein [Bacillus thuringiensis]MEC3516175.1 hypothetical protein [Bacillus thuringiensis]MED2072280.1 hypothetical protein [Bacillus thuringiensis]MED2223407.1 hypothetical protein [Bacillus thuringiensis]